MSVVDFLPITSKLRTAWNPRASSVLVKCQRSNLGAHRLWIFITIGKVSINSIQFYVMKICNKFVVRGFRSLSFMFMNINIRWKVHQYLRYELVDGEIWCSLVLSGLPERIIVVPNLKDGPEFQRQQWPNPIHPRDNNVCTTAFLLVPVVMVILEHISSLHRFHSFQSYLYFYCYSLADLLNLCYAAASPLRLYCSSMHLYRCRAEAAKTAPGILTLHTNTTRVTKPFLFLIFFNPLFGLWRHSKDNFFSIERIKQLRLLGSHFFGLILLLLLLRRYGLI